MFKCGKTRSLTFRLIYTCCILLIPRIENGWLFTVAVLHCKLGFWGENCTNRCNSTCFLSHCNPSNGICYQCDNMYWGDYCDKECMNCRFRWCHKTDGCSWCKSGYWRKPHCDKECNANCDGHCDQTNGRCTFSCKYRYWGKECENKCNFGPNCHRLSCNRVNGSCMACKSGFWGENCDNKCNNGPNCKYESCEQEDGSCGDCQKGYWGEQ